MFNGEIIFHLKSIGTEKYMWTSGFYRYENTYIIKKGRNLKKIMQLLWTVVTYLLTCKKMLNMELNMF